MKRRLGELRLGETFTSPLTGRPGVVLDWGHTRSYRHIDGPRRKLHTVLVNVGERQLLMSPDALVDVDAGRLNWSERDRPELRWGKYLGDSE
jgi:hypothetical protein